MANEIAKQNQVQPNNTFRLEGEVRNIRSIVSGINQNTGQEYNKLSFLLALYSEKYNREYLYPVTLWGAVAESTAKKIVDGDHISVGGVITSKEYMRDGEPSYFIYLTGYSIEVIAKADANAPQTEVAEADNYNDFPF